MKNTDLHYKIQPVKCETEIMKKLLSKNWHKTVVPLFGAA